MELKKMTIEGEYTENIRSVAGRMLELAKQGYIIDTIFNGTPLTTANMNSVEDILKQREDYEKRQYEAYKNLPQYEIDRAIAKQKELEEQSITESLLQEFRALDFNSVSGVADWIGRMATCRNNRVANITEVLPTLKASGYQSLSELLKSNPNKKISITAEEYVKFVEDLDEAGNYLVSRAMQDIQDLGTISGAMSYFIQIYQQRLNEQDKADDIGAIRIK